MAMFNNFYPYQNPNLMAGMQPNYFTPQQFQQPNQYPNQYSQGPVNTNKIFVNGIEDVKNRVLPNNSDFIFLDNDKDIMYRKVTDSTGKTTVHTYEIKKVDNEMQKKHEEVDMSKYALREDLDKFKREFESYKEKAEMPHGGQQVMSSVQNVSGLMNKEKTGIRYEED